MATDTATLRATLRTQYPAFGSIADASIDAKIDEARLWVPVDGLGTRADQALIYFSIYLSLVSPTALQLSEGGNVKRLKTDNAEIEFLAAELSTVGTAAQFKGMYDAFVMGKLRRYPIVLNVDSATGRSSSDV